jgi:hypothetical protein
MKKILDMFIEKIRNTRFMLNNIFFQQLCRL